MVEAMCQELNLQKEYLKSQLPVILGEKIPLQTVYFGGGTPSLLNECDLQLIFDTIQQFFTLLPDAEVTLEANPDDLTQEKLYLFRQFPINRLSIGIQSFHESHLQYINRAHTASQAENCVRLAQQAGFDNLSIDLIYAIPSIDHALWQADLERAVQLGVSHISSYCLTIEPKTAFGKWLARGKIKAADEEFAAQQFEILVDYLDRNGFEQYEISNFAKPGCYSHHNSSYWKQKPYLGIGPSAHSYNGSVRQYNVANNALYLKAIGEGQIPCTIEELTVKEQINEYVMTSIRTQWGCDTRELSRCYGVDILALHQSYLQNCQNKGLLLINDHTIQLTLKGKLLADQISSDLFMI